MAMALSSSSKLLIVVVALLLVWNVFTSRTIVSNSTVLTSSSSTSSSSSSTWSEALGAAIGSSLTALSSSSPHDTSLTPSCYAHRRRHLQEPVLDHRVHTLIHPALQRDLESLRKTVAPKHAPVLAFSERDYGGYYLAIYRDVPVVEAAFALHSLRIEQPDPAITNTTTSNGRQLMQLLVRCYEKPHYKGRYIELFDDTSDIGPEWSGNVRSFRIRRRTRKKGVVPPREFLFVTNRMLNKYIPGNLRSLDIAKALRALPDRPSVHFLTFDGDYNAAFAREMTAHGIVYHSDEMKGSLHYKKLREEAGLKEDQSREATASAASDANGGDGGGGGGARQRIRIPSDGFDLTTLLRSHSFHTVFLFEWYWSGQSAPERYIDAIRHLSPQTRVAVITDDAQGVRETMMQQAFSYFPHLKHDFGYLFDEVQLHALVRRERAVYSVADMVVPLTDRDAASLRPIVDECTPIEVLHWGTNLTLAAIPSYARLPHTFDQRRGLLFLGHYDNPTNRIALEWFFVKVFPLLSEQVRQVPVYMLGGEAREGYADPFASSGARIEFLGRQTNPEMMAHMHRARVMVSPILASTGMNTKNFYAMCSGIPVVTTTLGAGGLYQDAYKGTADDALFADAMAVADGAVAFAALLDRVYADAEVHARYTRGGLAMAERMMQSRTFHKDVRRIVDRLDADPAQSRLRPAFEFTSSDQWRDARLRGRRLGPREYRPDDRR